MSLQPSCVAEVEAKQVSLLPHQRPPATKSHAGGSVPDPGAVVINRKPAVFPWHEESILLLIMWRRLLGCAVHLIQKVHGEFVKPGKNLIAEGLLVLQESGWQVCVGTVWRCSSWGTALAVLMCVTDVVR